jgi:hypothetical protein
VTRPKKKSPAASSGPASRRLRAVAQQDFQEVFDRLRAIMSRHGRGLTTVAGARGEITLTGPVMKRWNKELWFGSVRIGKVYVSYHLMPVYMYPDLLRGVSPALRARMQGKSCFNFKRVDEDHFAELDRLTRTSVDRLRREGDL